MKKIIKVISISTLMLLFFALNMIVDKKEEKEINYKGLAMTIDGEVVEELPTEGYYYLNSTCEGGNLTWDIYNRTLKLKGDGSLNYSSCKLDFESIDLKIYISGVESNTLPSTEGYIVTSNCGDATITYTYPNLSITATENPGTCEIYFDITLKGKILADNTPQSDAVVNFSSPTQNIGLNGLFYTSDTTKTENGKVVYYYRGIVENNYLVFGNYCWRVVRTVEDGSVRLRYNGEMSVSNNIYTCMQTGSDIEGVEEGFTDAYCDEVCFNTEIVSHKSELYYKTNIKNTVERWYRDNIVSNSSLTNLIVDTPYCNDITEPTTINYFGAYDRLQTNNNPQYKCPSSTYAYTVAKGDLTYPVGLLTADEIVYAGGFDQNGGYYYVLGIPYWTMTPSYFLLSISSGSVFRVTQNGFASSPVQLYFGSVLPAISIKEEAIVSRGTGVYNDPYIILTN